MKTVGVDIGGTFTDLVGCINGSVVTSKTSTVPRDPTEGVATSLSLANCTTSEMDEILHGTTIAINTVLENKGATTALLTTRGFRDVYSIGRSNRIEAFNLFFHRPKPLIPPDLTYEIPERILADGQVLDPLDETAVHAVAAQLEARGVEAVAVCLLHSYANPVHEQRIGEILRDSHPTLFVTLSHEILREYREYERTSTTALNAFVGPRVQRYVRRLEGFLRDGEFAGNIRIMRSNGGVMSVSQAKDQPVWMMESGPVAGMIGAGRLSTLLGLDRCVGFDMGGTTAKSSLIANGAPEIANGYVIGHHASGQPMQLPVVDIVEVGAGGGSVAWIDETGGLHVGPHSMGADPGPACYGRGAGEPTVTDADLLLGRINARRFLDGGMDIDETAAAEAVRQKVADPLGLGVTEAALGIARIVDASMSLSVRAVSVNKGVDPRDATLIAFGGAGPLHAATIAREIFVPQVVIPKLPGTFSALGMLMASWRQDFMQTMIGRLGELNPANIKSVFEELADSGREHLRRDEVSQAAAVFSYFADLRYVGQEHAIPILVEAPEMLADDTAVVRERFHLEHAQRYGQSAPDESLELVSLRLVLTASREDSVAEDWLAAPWRPEGDADIGEREVVFDEIGGPLKTQILWRPGLEVGTEVVGPAVIEEPNSTTLLHPGDAATVTDSGHLIIRIAQDAR